MRLFVTARDELQKFANKLYRDGFMQTQVRGGIAYQIRALREKFALSQSEFAEKTGKKQSVISRLESTEYGKASVQTLLDIASANDVALVVRFVSYPEFLAQTADMSPEGLKVDTIHESLAQATTAPAVSNAWAIEVPRSNQPADQSWLILLAKGKPSGQGGLPQDANKPRLAALDYARPN